MNKRLMFILRHGMRTGITALHYELELLHFTLQDSIS